MAAGRLNMVVFAAVLVAALLQSSDAQTSHTVGDSTGWTTRITSPSFYANWAANLTFVPGDILVFNFPAGIHDVAEVSRTAYDSCNAGNTVTLITTSPANITLSTAGEHFFICTFPGHCSSGQKLAVNVTGNATAPAAPPANPPASPPATPPVSPPATPPATPPPSTPTSPSPAPTATPPSTPSSPSPSPSTATPPSGGAPTPSGSTPSPSGSTPPPSPPSAPSPSSPSPAGGVTPPPPPSSAPSAALSAALPLALLSVAVALLY